MKILYIMALVVLTNTLSAQAPDDHSAPDNHKNEVGIANAPVYILKEKEFAYGLHGHYVRNISQSRFGIGVGYERIFDEHKHSSAGLILSYDPIEHLAISLSPGITFQGSDVSEMHFGLHLEALYEFEIGFFHIGPVVEFAYAPEDYHLSLGVHIGIGF